VGYDVIRMGVVVGIEIGIDIRRVQIGVGVSCVLAGVAGGGGGHGDVVGREQGGCFVVVLLLGTVVCFC